MLTEKDIVRHCDSRVLRRARNIIRATGSVYDRSCKYDPGASGVTRLHTHVKSSADWRMNYDVILTVDENSSDVIDYDCTCAAAFSYSGMCKHVVATALTFLDQPDTFAGYDLNRNARSSESVLKVMKTMSFSASEQARLEVSDEQERAHAETEHPGTVELGLTLVHDSGRWAARFRVAGSSGRYVVKDVFEFIDAVEKESFFSYGTKLSFTHRMSMFAPHASETVRFLQKAVCVRRELEHDSMSTFNIRATGSGRDFFLSSPEVIELLDLFAGHPFYVDDLSRFDHKPRRSTVVEGNPPARVLFSAVPDGGFEVRRDGDMVPISHAGQMYVWQEGTFYHCMPEYLECEPFLREVYCNPSEVQFISAQDAPAFCSVVLPALERHLDLEEPEEMAVMRPRPVEVQVFLDRSGQGCTCEAYARYDDERCDLFEADGGRERLSVGLRDLVAEKRVRSVIARYFPVVEGKPTANADAPLRIVDSGDVARLLFEGLADLRACAQVFTTEEFDSLVSSRRPTVSMGLSLHANLIDLKVSAEDFPQNELAELLESYRLRRRYHRMRDGRFLDMAEVDLHDLDEVADELGLSARQISSGEIDVEGYRAFQLDALLDDVGKDSSFKQYVDSFSQSSSIQHEVPPHFKGILRPYQVEGFKWLNMLCDMNLGGILADEMGLGKSVQLISFIASTRKKARSHGPNLIVCPASLIYNWAEEFAKFSSELEVATVAGSRDERAWMLAGISDQCDPDKVTTIGEDVPDVIVTSYDLLRRDVEMYAKIPFFSMTLDEAQYIKNHATLAAQAVKELGALHKFALTGTPIENRLSELWSIFDFLMPGLLGSYRKFRDRFEAPIIDGDEATTRRLQEVVGNFILRRLKKDVLVDLPDKNETVVFARLEGEQRRLYHAHEQRLRESLAVKSGKEFNSNKLAVLAELMKLRELCCDPGLLFSDYEGGSAKLDAIVELVDTALDSGAKMLVFSQFTGYLDLIAEKLERKGIAFYTITGSTPKHQRVELVNDFNEDDTPVFLVSLKAGGTGLNLIGASVVVHADPWWNSAAENQATDRAHRIGQTRDVMVYKVIAKDTVEERILDLQQAKSELADKLVGESGGSLSSLTRDDLVKLLEG